MDSPWQPLVDGRTTVDPIRNALVARMWVLPHRLEYPEFVVPAFSDPTVILAHVGARLDLPERSLHVDFGPLTQHSLLAQDWTVWRDEPWPDLDALVRQGSQGAGGGSQPGMDPAAHLAVA